MDDVIGALFEYFDVSKPWLDAIAWTIASQDTTRMRSLTVEQIREVQITLGILN